MDQMDCNDSRELIFDEKIKIGLEGSVVSYFKCVYNTQTNTCLVKIIMEIPLIPEVNMESIMENVKKPLGAY